MRILQSLLACAVAYIVIRVVLTTLFGGGIAEEIGVGLSNFLMPIVFLIMIVRSIFGSVTQNDVLRSVTKVVGIGGALLLTAYVVSVINNVLYT